MSRTQLSLLFLLLTVAARLPVLLSYADAWQTFEIHTGNIALGFLDGIDMNVDRIPAMPHNRGNALAGLMLAPFYAVFGPTAFVMKLFTVLWHAFTVMLIVGLLDRFFNRRAAVAGGLLFVFAPPMFVKLSVLAYASHMEATLFMVLGLIPFLAITMEGKADVRRYLFFGLAIGAAAFYHLQSLLFCLGLFALLVIQRPRETLTKGLLAGALGLVITGGASLLFAGGNIDYVAGALFSDKPAPAALGPTRLDNLQVFLEGGAVEALDFGEAGAELGTVLGAAWLALLLLACATALWDDRVRVANLFRRVFRFRDAELSPVIALACHPLAVLTLFFVSSMQLKLGHLGSGYENRRLVPVLFSMFLLAAVGLGGRAVSVARWRSVALLLLALIGAAGLAATGRPNPASSIPQRGEAYEWFKVHLTNHTEGDPDRMVDTIVEFDRGDLRFASLRYTVHYPGMRNPGADEFAIEARLLVKAELPDALFRATALGRAIGARGDITPTPALTALLDSLSPPLRAAVLHGIGLGLPRLRPAGQLVAYLRGLRKVRLDLAAWEPADGVRIIEGFGFTRGFTLLPYSVALFRPLSDVATFPTVLRDAFMRGFGWGYRQRWLEVPDEVPEELAILQAVPGPGREALIDGLIGDSLPPEAEAMAPFVSR